MLCPKCKNEIGDTLEYCYFCGSKLEHNNIANDSISTEITNPLDKTDTNENTEDIVEVEEKSTDDISEVKAETIEINGTSEPTGKKLGKKKIIIISSIIALVVIAVVVVICIINSRHNEHYSSYSDYSSYSSPSYQMDHDTYCLLFMKISNVNVTHSSSYAYINGTITNTGTYQIKFVKVRAACKDYSGNVIDTDWTYAVDSSWLNPGESKTFQMMVPDSGQKIASASVIVEY